LYRLKMLRGVDDDDEVHGVAVRLEVSGEKGMMT
jgi:hypothetical protein